MRPSGFNPMRWNCERGGCFNIKRRPKIEVFAECFPRRINFGDVDGIVELNGSFCMLEWKGQGGSVGAGQLRSYVAFTRTPGNIVFVVEGDAETMSVTRYRVFWSGRNFPFISANLEAVKNRIKKWATFVQHQKAA